MFTWVNGLPVFTAVDFRAWRNGLADIDWGTYHNLMTVHRAILFENGTYNFKTTATDIKLVDSQPYATTAYPTATGAFIGRVLRLQRSHGSVAVRARYLHRTRGPRVAGP